MPSIFQRSRSRIPVVLVSTTLLKFASTWRAAALAIPDIGIAVFFIAGVAASGAGVSAPWFVLAAVLLGLACRTLDVEGWGLFIPGGLAGRAGLAFGPRAAAAAAAAQLFERVLFASLVAVVFGHYAAALPVKLFVPAALWPNYLRSGDPAGVAAVALLGFAWMRARLGYATNVDRAVSRTWGAVFALALLAVWGAFSLWVQQARGALPVPTNPFTPGAGEAGIAGAAAALLFAFGHAMPAVASGDSLARAAGELEPPRIRGLHRTMGILTIYGTLVTAGSAFLFHWLVPADLQRLLTSAPLLAIVQQLGGPPALKTIMTLAIVVSGALLLGQAARAGIVGAERMLAQLAQQGGVSRALTVPHARLGTLARAIDTAAGAAALAIVMSGGRVEWIARAYAVGLAWTLLLKIAVLVRLRRKDSPFRVPFNLPVGRSEWPLGVAAIGIAVGATWLTMVAWGDPPTIGASVALVVIAAIFGASARSVPTELPDEVEPFQLLPSKALTLAQVDARPGGVLVPVRNPTSLAHVSHAFYAAGDRDVVVMTARVLGVEAEYEDPHDVQPTASERVLFSNIVSMAERHGRSVRLLIVPSYNVFDAVVASVLRLHASDVFVGESATLSTEAQAQPAWRGVGAGRRAGRARRPPGRSTTAAAGPTPITSARTIRHFRPAISISSISCGSTPSRRSGPTCTITTWCGRL